MAFDFAAGLSAMGGSIAQTAGLMAIEEQRAANSREMAELADKLAGERESRGRSESHGYAMLQQEGRQKFDEPLQKAQTASLISQTTLREDEAGRKRGAGDAVSNSLLGGGSNSYADRVAQFESGGRDAVPNALGSGAFGKYQIMPGTWAELRKEDPSLPEDITKATPEQHRSAFDRFTAKNADALQKAGIDATPTNLYLAHRFGAAGAEKVIKAGADTPLSNVLPPEWQRQNPDMQGKTAGDFTRMAEERMKGVTIGGGSDDGMPADYRRSLAIVAKYDPDKAVELEGRWREKNMEIKARSAESDKGIAAREREHEKTIRFEMLKAQRLVPLDGGMMGTIDLDGKVTPIMGADGKPYTGFVDKERQGALSTSLASTNKQVDEMNTIYRSDLREAERRLSDVTKNSFGQKDAGKDERDYIAKIKDEHFKRIEPLRAMQERLLDELMGGKTKNAGAGNKRRPLDEIFQAPGEAPPLLGSRPY